MGCQKLGSIMNTLNNPNKPNWTVSWMEQDIWSSHLGFWETGEYLTIVQPPTSFFTPTHTVYVVSIFSLFIALPGCKQEEHKITTQLSIWTLIQGNAKLFHWPQTDWVVGCRLSLSLATYIHPNSPDWAGQRLSARRKDSHWCLINKYWRLAANPSS